MFSVNKYENANFDNIYQNANNRWHFHILLAEKCYCSAVFNKKKYAIDSNLGFISKITFMISRVEREKRFITSGPGSARA